MPTYNHNNTPIFPQQSTDDWVSTAKDGVGVYSNYQLQSRVQLLQDMPLDRHVPGEGRHPHNVQMSRWFTGEGQINIQPLADPGGDPDTRPTYLRFDHLEWHGVPSAQQLGGDYGHLPGRVTSTSRYSNWIYDGIKPQGEPLADPGHAPRNLGDAGVAATFGRTNPMDHQSKALSAQGPLEDPGDTYVSPDSHFSPKTWRGLPSAKAL